MRAIAGQIMALKFCHAAISTSVSSLYMMAPGNRIRRNSCVLQSTLRHNRSTLSGSSPEDRIRRSSIVLHSNLRQNPIHDKQPAEQIISLINFSTSKTNFQCAKTPQCISYRLCGDCLWLLCDTNCSRRSVYITLVVFSVANSYKVGSSTFSRLGNSTRNASATNKSD